MSASPVSQYAATGAVEAVFRARSPRIVPPPIVSSRSSRVASTRARASWSPGSPSSSAARPPPPRRGGSVTSSPSSARGRARLKSSSPRRARAAPLPNRPPRPRLGGFGFLATEEEADADAAGRLARLRALVARKRLCFAIINRRRPPSATSPTAAPSSPPSATRTRPWRSSRTPWTTTSADAPTCASSTSLIALEGLERVGRAEGVAAATAEPAHHLRRPGRRQDSHRRQSTRVHRKTRRVRRQRVGCVRACVACVPTRRRGAIDEGEGRLEDAFDGGPATQNPSSRRSNVSPGSKSVHPRVTHARAWGKLREETLSAAASAAEYTKGVWSRLNGGADGHRSGGQPRSTAFPNRRRTRRHARRACSFASPSPAGPRIRRWRNRRPPRAIRLWDGS